jgi:hypothetical protein
LVLENARNGKNTANALIVTSSATDTIRIIGILFVQRESLLETTAAMDTCCSAVAGVFDQRGGGCASSA